MQNSTFLLSMLLRCRSHHCSALERLEIRLKAQVVKPIDDGGVSMFFRRDFSSSQQSRRVVLSVEVCLLLTSLTLGKTEKTRKRK